MPTEEQIAQAAADAAAKAAAGSADAGTVKDAAYWERVAREAIDGRDKAKAKLKEVEPFVSEGQKAIDARKTAEERIVGLTQERDGYKTQAEEATDAMTARLAVEIAAIPEAMRALVPAALSPAKQLEWIGSAQAAGLFGVKSASPGAELHGGQGGTVYTQAQVAAMSSTQRTQFYADKAAGKVTLAAG